MLFKGAGHTLMWEERGLKTGGMGGIHLTGRRDGHSKQKEQRLQPLEPVGGHLHEEAGGEAPGSGGPDRG